MAATREELREHLTAVIEAAQELPREDRTYLADTFLDQLETQFQLIPRSATTQRGDRPSAGPRFPGLRLGRGALPIGVMLLLAVLALPFLLVSMFVLVHLPVFLLAVALLLVFRFSRRGRPWRYGPRGGNTARYYH